MRAWFRESRELGRLAWPVAVGQLASMLLWTVDLLMVGRLGVLELNAVSLGRLWLMGTSIVGMGFLMGVDPIASQAFGAGDEVRWRRARSNGLGLALWLSVPVGGLWLLTEPVLLFSGQEPEVARLAARYVLVQLPGLPCFLIFIALRQLLQARGLVRPAMAAALAANGFNLLANWVLIFGKLGFPALGVVGAGLASLGTEVALLGFLLLFSRGQGSQNRGPAASDSASVTIGEMREIARLGLPVALQMLFEYWAFAWTTLRAGRLGEIELAAHSIALNLASISYMVPLGIAQAATVRVGNRIGAGESAGARQSAWVAMGLGAAVMALFAVGFLLGRWKIPQLYGVEAAVLVRAAAILPIVGAFELFDGLQVVGAGVLRGMGRTRPAAWANLVGYYGLALPAALWLSGPLGWGLEGLWWGLALGLLAIASALTVYLARCPVGAFAPLARGPSSSGRHSRRSPSS